MTQDVFRVVFVCTGNRFRSPLAAAVFRAAANGLPVDVSSVGTLHLADVGVLPEAAEAARRFGLDLQDHRVRSLATTPLSGADLVVGFERMHVVTAVVDGKARRDRTFTLPELTGLLQRAAVPGAATPVERAREAVRSAAAQRPQDDPQLHAVPQLQDPLGLPRDEQNAIAGRVRELTLQLREQLFG
jgi:protein-tyrosine phosphatase